MIGTGGKVIREIVEKTGAKINVEDDGTVKVASADGELIKAAVNWIKSIASDPEIGHIYEGTVVKTMDFGAFVNFFGAKDGLVHISQLAANRVQKTTDVVKEGDKVKVKLLGFDERGKVRLSMKVVDQATGEDLEAKQKAEPQQAAGARISRRQPTGQNRSRGAFGRPFFFKNRMKSMVYGNRLFVMANTSPIAAGRLISNMKSADAPVTRTRGTAMTTLTATTDTPSTSSSRPLSASVPTSAPAPVRAGIPPSPQPP